MTKGRRARTDNRNPAVKIHLRRHFLQKYHGSADPPNVLDCCQGEGLLWRVLRKEFDLAGYWGVDLKPARGRLKLDSTKILAQPGWDQNVVDIDTYGAPWKHWLAMLPHVSRPTTVFLTIGVGGPKLIKLGKEELHVMGVPEQVIGMKASGALTHEFLDLSIQYCLAEAYNHGLTIVEAREAYEPPAMYWRTRYVGVRIEPA